MKLLLEENKYLLSLEKQISVHGSLVLSSNSIYFVFPNFY